MIEMSANGEFLKPYDIFIRKFKTQVLNKIETLHNDKVHGVESMRHICSISPNIFAQWMTAYPNKKRCAGMFHTTTSFKHFIRMLYDLRRISYGPYESMLTKLNDNIFVDSAYMMDYSVANLVVHDSSYWQLPIDVNAVSRNAKTHSYESWNNPKRLGKLLIELGIPSEIVADQNFPRACLRYIRLWYLIWEFIGMRECLGDQLTLQDMCDITDTISIRLYDTINHFKTKYYSEHQ